MEAFQIGEQEKTQRHIGSADGDFPTFQIAHLQNPFFPRLELFIALFHIGKKLPSFRCGGDAVGGAFNEYHAQRSLQLLQALAHRRLGERQRSGGLGDRAAFDHMIKYFIIFQICHHKKIPHTRPFSLAAILSDGSL